MNSVDLFTLGYWVVFLILLAIVLHGYIITKSCDFKRVEFSKKNLNEDFVVSYQNNSIVKYDNLTKRYYYYKVIE